MTQDKLKRLATPKSWPMKRKGIKFITKPKPGSHKLEFGISLTSVLRDILNYAKNKKEVKKLLFEKEVLVDGKRRKDEKFQVGLFDVVEIPQIKEQFRCVINKRNKLEFIKIEKEEASLKPCKIVGKTKIKGKIQINLFDGKNILIEKADYKCRDTLLITLPKYEIKSHFKLEKGAIIFLTGGKHLGDVGTVEDIKPNKIIYKEIKSGKSFETAKDFAFVIGDKKPVIKLNK